MTLIVDGASQGKLDYALRKTGYGPAQVARTPEEARTRPILAGLEDQPELDEIALLEADPGVILTCDEVSYDVMPAEPTQRARREAVGRLYCRLTARAKRAEHISCGLPVILKEEGPWN